MHQEMMGRRLKHMDWGIPQLILIDGGRGQVRGSWEILQRHPEFISGSLKKIPTRKSTGLPPVRNDVKNIPIFGLAKREEWLYPPEGEVIKLPKRSLALRLLQKIRNESHRFAINYHRKLRKKAFGV